MGLLRLNKDATVTKLTLALFTEDLADNKELGARVAHLEAELAGVALRHERKVEALHSLVAAAGAHRVLGQTTQALSCLKRAASLKAGDDETQALLQEAVADLEKQLKRAAPLPKKAAPAPKAEKKPEPKPEPKAEESAEDAEEPKPEPKAEESAEESAEDAEEPKAEKPKKKARKCGTCGEEGHDSRTCEQAADED